MPSNDEIRQDPTGGAKPAAKDKRPRDDKNRKGEPSDTDIEFDAHEQARDSEQAFEKGIARLPPG